MSLLSKLTIRGKLMAIILVVTIMSLSAAFAFVINYEIRDERQGLVENSKILARTVAAYSVADLIFGDTRASDETLAKLSSNQNIIHANIFDAQGRFFNDLYDHKHAEQLIYNKETTSFSDGVLNVYEPIVHEDIHYGTLHLVVSTAELTETITRVILFSLLLMALLVLASYLLASWLQKFISTPILQLASVAEKVSESGDYTARTKYSGDDEVAVLYSGFNHMLDTIQQGIDERDVVNKELTSARDGLEQRVRERTKNLENTNRLLCEEIESRKRILHKLKQQAQIIDQIHDSVVATDLDGIVTSWNKGAEHLFGYATGEAIGQHISFVYPEDQYEFLANEIIRPLKEQGSLEREVVMCKKSGELFHALLSLSMLFDEEGNVTGMVGYSLDITQRKYSEELLLDAKQIADAANMAKTEFLSRMSHELRTPLNAVIGFAHILSLRLEDDEHKNHVGEIAMAGKHLLNLIEEIMDLSRIEAGQIAITLERIELRELLSEAVNFIQPEAEKHGISLEFSNCKFSVLADSTRLKEIILNLLSNAVKYNKENGFIKVNCTVEAGQVKISVSDSGIGFTEEQKAMLFEPFSRLGAEFTGIQGTGIGMTIVKRLVELMGGKIEVDSVVGQGSRFDVYLSEFIEVETY